MGLKRLAQIQLKRHRQRELSMCGLNVGWVNIYTMVVKPVKQEHKGSVK